MAGFSSSTYALLYKKIKSVATGVKSVNADPTNPNNIIFTLHDNSKITITLSNPIIFANKYSSLSTTGKDKYLYVCKEDDGDNKKGIYIWDTTDSKYVEMNRLAAGYLLTSHGGTFLHAGEEFARSKSGNENSYNAGDFVNKLDWTRTSSYSDLVSYYHGMIDIRKAFSGFRNIYTESGETVEENTETGFFNKVNGNNLTEIKEFTSVTGGKDKENHRNG